MRRPIITVTVASLLAALPTPATATDYKLKFSPSQGNVLKGRGGLEVYDVRTDDMLLRVISPGSRITERGTVRVLVMNLRQPTFEFGPDQVSVELPSGVALKELPYQTFDKVEPMVAREVEINRATDVRVKNGLAFGHGPDAWRLDDYSDDVLGSKLASALNQVLRPYEIGPNEAWGGYLLFEIPAAIKGGKADQPVTIVVKTGDTVHRVEAVLRRV